MKMEIIEKINTKQFTTKRHRYIATVNVVSIILRLYSIECVKFLFFFFSTRYILVCRVGGRGVILPDSDVHTRLT